MQKLGLALALIFAFSTACSAGQANPAHKHVRATQERQSKAEVAQKSDDESQKTDEEIMGEDPYWDRCLSYYRGWGPGACGR
jgi:hypothetical protein